MNRKMIGWIALAVIVVGGLFYGMNAALGSEPAPKNYKPRVTKVAKQTDKAADTSTDTGTNALDTAKNIFNAIQDSDNPDNAGSTSPLGFLKDLGKNDK